MSSLSDNYYNEMMRLGPLGYWPLADAVGSGVAKDESGNGRDGTVVGGVTFGQSPLLKASTLTSALGDGTSGYIDLPTAGLPFGAQPWSMAIWARLPAIPGDYPYVISIGGASALQLAGFYYNTGAGALALGTDDGSSDIYSSIPVVANHVYFLVGTYDGITASFYCYDATSKTFDVHSSALVFNIIYGTALMGMNPAFPYYWPGDFAHGVILPVTLTTDQIKWLYNVGMGAGILHTRRGFGRIV